MSDTRDKDARWHGTPGGYSNHKCRCDRCRAAAREYRTRYRARYDSAPQPQQTRYVVRHKRKGGVGNRGQFWTGPDLEYITARDADGNYLRSELHAALVLGRTVLAVERARHRCLHDPQYAARAGLPVLKDGAR